MPLRRPLPPYTAVQIVLLMTIVMVCMALAAFVNIGRSYAQTLPTDALCADITLYAPEFAELCRDYPVYIVEMLLPLARAGELPPPLVARVFLHEGERLALNQDTQAALAAYTSAVNADPDLAPAYAGRARLYTALGDADAALRDLSLLILLSPLDEQAYLSRAALWLGRGESENALLDWDNALLINPVNYNTYAARAAYFLQSGEYASAARDYSAALEGNPTDTILLRQRASAYNALGEFQNARSDLQALVDLGGSNFDSLYALALLSEQLGDYTVAVEWHTHALTFNPDSAWAYYCRGFAHIQLGNIEAAQADYERAIALEPDQPVFYAERAALSQQMGDFDSALRDANRAVSLASTRFTLLTRARIHAARGDEAAAHADLDAAYSETSAAVNTREYAQVVLTEVSFAEQFGDADGALTRAHAYIDDVAALGTVIVLDALPVGQPIRPGEQFRIDLTLPAGTTELRLTADATQLDLGLGVRLKADGTPLAFNDDCADEAVVQNHGACLRLTMAAPTEVTLIALDFSGAVGSFSLTMTAVEPSADATAVPTPDTP